MAAADSVVTNLCIAASCIFVSRNLGYYLPGAKLYWYILALSTILSLINVLVAQWVLLHLTNDLPGYKGFLIKSIPVRFCVSLLLIACMGMISIVYYTLGEQKERERRKAEVEKLSKDAELHKLRHQLQPHFLFNSLNSISALTAIDPERARLMIQNLSDFLRGTLRKDEQQWIQLTEELQYLELYLSIEKVRFGHRLHTVISRDEGSTRMQLPCMLLQPIVENAIRFGVYDTTGDVAITIEATSQDQQLLVTICNPFDPETSRAAQGTGFGLHAVQRRLELLFGRTDLLSTKTHEQLFICSIKIPQPVS
ncbi:MAG: histidine kinase [Williamsia sp.]|nr:histidine kinase [Williamsia sp.]